MNDANVREITDAELAELAELSAGEQMSAGPQDFAVCLQTEYAG